MVEHRFELCLASMFDKLSYRNIASSWVDAALGLPQAGRCDQCRTEPDSMARTRGPDVDKPSRPNGHARAQQQHDQYVLIHDGRSACHTTWPGLIGQDQ